MRTGVVEMRRHEGLKSCLRWFPPCRWDGREWAGLHDVDGCAVRGLEMFVWLFCLPDESSERDLRGLGYHLWTLLEKARLEY